MSARKFALLLFFLGLWFAQLIAQHDSYIHYAKTDGIPSINVYSCSQDKEGFMWFGTDNGLCRYDGKHFYKYTNLDGLPDNEIIQVIADKNGGIWGRTYVESIFYYYKGVFYTDFGKGFRADKISHIEADENGGIWAYYDFVPFKEDSMLKCAYMKYGKVEKMIAVPKYSRNDEMRERIRNLDITKQNYIVTIDNTHIFLDKETLKIVKEEQIPFNFKQEKPYKTAFFKFADMKYELLYEEEGSLLIAYRTAKNGSFSYVDTVQFRSRVIDVYLHKEKLYVSLREGGYVILDKDLAYSGELKRYLPEIYIGKIYTDKEDNFWFTSSSGIFFLPQNPILVLDKQEGFKNEHFYSIFVDNEDNLYAGSSLEVIYKKSQNRLDSIFYNKVRQNERVIKILQDAQNRIWYGTDRGLYWVNQGKAVLVSDKMAVKSLIVSKDNRYLYVGSHADVQKIDLLHFSPFQKGEVLLSEKCFGLAEDRQGGIWLGGKNALYYYDGKKVENISQKINPKLLQKIQRLAISKDGTLWIASNTEGLIALKDGEIKIIIGNTTYGITNNVCTSLFIDEKNQLWLGTKSGLNKVVYQYEKNTLTYKVSQYSTSKGLTDDEIQDVFVKNEKAYIATTKGICILRDVPVAQKHEVEKAHIWRLQVANKDTNLVGNYVFSYDEKQITLYFSRLCFDCSGEPIYEYRLLPEQTDWTITNEQSLTFNYLNNGNYQFEIRLKDKPTSVSTFSFTIATPFWKTKMAIFMYILLSVGIIYAVTTLILRERIKKERAEKGIKHKISELEMKAIKSQMNPHFIFNCIQSIQYYYSIGDSLNANNYISKFAQLIRSTLEISEKPFIPLGEEAAYLQNYLMLEEMRFKNLFAYSIDISEEIDKDAQMFPALLLQPYVENAIKHGIRNNPKKKGLIFIRFYKQENNLICEVEDNGVGRVRAAEIKNNSFLPKHDSKGMKLSHNRIELLNELEVMDIQLQVIDKYSPEKEAQGTLIRLVMPFSWRKQTQDEDISISFLLKTQRIIQKIYVRLAQTFIQRKKDI